MLYEKHFNIHFIQKDESSISGKTVEVGGVVDLIVVSFWVVIHIGIVYFSR